MVIVAIISSDIKYLTSSPDTSHHWLKSTIKILVNFPSISLTQNTLTLIYEIHAKPFQDVKLQTLLIYSFQIVTAHNQWISKVIGRWSFEVENVTSI